MRADRRLCLDRSRGRLVEAGSVESAFLLAGKGQEIEPEDVKRLGLVLMGDRVEQARFVKEPVKPEPEEVAELLGAAEMAPEPAEESPAEPGRVMPSQSRRSRRRY